MARDLTSGSLLRAIAVFSIPYLFTYFLQTFYGTADLFIIGIFSNTAATSAVASGSQIMHMLTVMIVGLAMGATVTVAQAVGKKNEKEEAQFIGNTASLFIAVALGMTAILLCLVDPIVAIMQTPTAAVEGTSIYLLICFAGIPFITAYNVIAAVFRGLGDTKSPLVFVAIACVFNIALDVLFIGYFDMGAAGAAFGTIIAQAISVAISLVAIRKMRLLPSLSKRDFKPKKPIVNEIIKIGLPISLQDGFIQVAFILITVFANMRGLDDAAAVGIVEKIICVIFLVPSSLLSTMSAVGAQNIGANQHNRVKQTMRISLVIAVGYGLAIAIVTQFCSEGLVGLFSSDSHVIVLAGEYLRGYVWDTAVAGVHFIFSGYFTAYGISIVSFIHNCASILLGRVPLSYWTSVTFLDTLWPMGIAVPIGSSISVIICIGVYAWLEKHPEKIGKPARNSV